MECARCSCPLRSDDNFCIKCGTVRERGAANKAQTWPQGNAGGQVPTPSPTSALDAKLSASALKMTECLLDSLRPKGDKTATAIMEGAASITAKRWGTSDCQCGKPFLKNDAFCRSCGSKREVKRCKSCTRVLMLSDAFCTHCGESEGPINNQKTLFLSEEGEEKLLDGSEFEGRSTMPGDNMVPIMSQQKILAKTSHSNVLGARGRKLRPPADHGATAYGTRSTSTDAFSEKIAKLEAAKNAALMTAGRQLASAVQEPKTMPGLDLDGMKGSEHQTPMERALALVEEKQSKPRRASVPPQAERGRHVSSAKLPVPEINPRSLSMDYRSSHHGFHTTQPAGWFRPVAQMR